MFKGTIILIKDMIILVQRHDYSCLKSRLFLLKYTIIMFKNTIILVQKHDYSCSNVRLFLLKNTIIISGCTIIKSGCTESNAKTCISDTVSIVFYYPFLYFSQELFLLSAALNAEQLWSSMSYGWAIK